MRRRDSIVAEGAEHHLPIKQRADVFAVVSDGLGPGRIYLDNVSSGYAEGNSSTGWFSGSILITRFDFQLIAKLKINMS